MNFTFIRHVVHFNLNLKESIDGLISGNSIVINEFNLRKFSYKKQIYEILLGSSWTFVARMLATGMGIINTIIIIRYYGSEIMGIVAMLNSFLMIVSIITVFGTTTSILRLIPEHMAKYSFNSAFKVYRKVHYVVIGISLFAGLIVYFSSGILADFVFSKPYLRYYFALASGFIIFKSLTEINTEAIRALRLIRIFAFMQVLPSISKFIILIIITCFYFHYDNPIYSVLFSMIITAISGICMMEVVFRKKTNPNDPVRLLPIKSLLFLSLPMMFTTAMTTVMGQAGVIMLGMLRSEAEVAYFLVSVRIVTLTSAILFSVNAMLGPIFSDLFYSSKIEDLLFIAKTSAKLVFWITTPILLCIVAFGKPILVLLFGIEFTAAYPAVTILAIGQFINSASGSVAYFLNMTGYQKMLRNIIFVASLINIGLNYLLIPIHGIYGASVALTLSTIVWNVASLAYIKYKFGKTTAYIPTLP